MFDNQEMTPELILWGKVVEMAFSDAFVDEDFWKKTHHQERNVFKYNYDQAHAWFSLGNKDFIMTCQYAGVETRARSSPRAASASRPTAAPRP